jgi:hypothetical protein
MTPRALQSTINLVLRDLGLGVRCWSSLTLSDGCMSGYFFVPKPTEHDADKIVDRFTKLTQKHHWKPPVVTIDKTANLIFVSIDR